MRALIDCLPFTPERYARAKSVLLPNLGKPSEVATTLIQSITFLPVVFNSTPNKTQEFYEKLIVSLQALDIMHKLRDIKGYVRLILDKFRELGLIWSDWMMRGKSGVSLSSSNHYISELIVILRQ